MSVIDATSRDARGGSVDAAAATAVGATVLTGLLAGLYYAYSVSVMPGLAAGEDRTLVSTMTQINDAILNPAFYASFVGAPVATAATAYVLRRRGERRRARWALGALGGHAVAFVTTVAVNVPLNEALARDGGRAAFESTWNAANDVRTLASTAALALLAVCLASRSSD